MTQDAASPLDAEVLIVGGGVMGTSTAFHLAAAGVTDVVLIEAAGLASGSSGKPLGGVRAQFSDAVNIELGARSLEAFRRFSRDIGVDIGLREVGYLFALRDPADVAPFEASVALQRDLGVRSSRLISPVEAGRRCGYLDPALLVAAVWAPEAGFARPVAVVTGYATAAAALGVSVRAGHSVVAIDDAGGGRALVRLDDGTTYRTPVVVCAAGAWSAAVAALAGVALPIEPQRRQVAFSNPLDPPAAPPFTIDFSSTAYFHGAEDGGLLAGWADPAEPIGFDRQVSDEWHRPLRESLRAFAPALAEVPFVRGWAGLYEVTPDCNAVIGETDVGFRFLYAAGFSGHGFLQGPAVGECVAALIRHREPPVDISGFTADRFRQPVLRTEIGII